MCCGCLSTFSVNSPYIYIPFVMSRPFMAGAASQAVDADSSRAPGLTSGLQGSVNVHRGALLLVPQWQCISYFVFYYIATYIFVNDWQCIIIMIIHTYVVYNLRRTLYDMGEKRLTCSFNFASFLCTETHPSFVIRWWYPHSCCQWHEEDLSDSWIKDTRWKVMVILGYWTLHHFHTQTQQSLHIDWWYFLRCGNDFWRIYTDFWAKIWQVKIKLRVLIAATGSFVSVG